VLIAFRSKAGAEVLMLWTHAEAVLRALGREPSPQGVFRGPQLEAALQAWAQHPAESERPAQADPDLPQSELKEVPPLLAQRAWPVCELLRRALLKQCDVTWDKA
jgi:hypothetical protein